VTRSPSIDAVVPSDVDVRPRDPLIVEPHDGPIGESEALFREARARRRRRWTIGLLLAVLVLVAALVASIVTTGPTTARRETGIPRTSSPTPAAIRGAPLLGWVDYLGNLHIGNASTGHQRIVGRAAADPTTPLVSLDGRLFWVGTGCSYLPVSKCPYSPWAGLTPLRVKEFDPITKKTVSLVRGDTVFAGADGRSLDVVQPRLDCPASVTGACNPYAQDLATIPLTAGGTPRVVPVPAGWYVNAGDGYSNPISVANGILVQSALPQATSTPLLLGLWDTATGRVRVLGRDWGLINAYTAHRGGASLLAWLPGACGVDPECSLRITNTVTGHTLEVHSPLPYGFDIGGAFSPDGSELAVFVKTNSGAINPAMQLALVDTSTGSLRLIPGVQGEIGESVGWARWLPGGTSVLAGTFSSEYRTYSHYLVNTTTGAVKTVDFSLDRNRDVNFSASTIGGLPGGLG